MLKKRPRLRRPFACGTYLFVWEYSLCEHLLYFGRYILAVGAACKTFSSNAHHTSHILHRCGSRLGDDGLDLCRKFLGCQLLGQNSADLDLRQLLPGQIGSVLLRVYCGRIGPLLCEFGDDLDDVGIGQLVDGSADVLASMIYFLMLRSALRRTASRAFMAAIISFEMVFSNDIASVIYSFTLYLAACFCIFFLHFLIHCLLVAAASLEEGQHAAHEHVAL